MADNSSRKLPRRKADSYSTVALADTTAVTPLLSGLTIASCNPTAETDVIVPPVVHGPEATETERTHGSDLVTMSTRMSCTCCSVVFSHRTEQKAHFKCDWHRYNLKQQLRGESSITEDQFEAMTGDVSSISGSEDSSASSTEDDKPSAVPGRLKNLRVVDSTDTTDSETDDVTAVMAATRRHPKVFLRNGSGQLISLYRCILYHKKTPPSTPTELLSLAEQAKTYTRVAMVMLAGGHFSAAIFDRKEPVVHKTFHRYVVRAKRGTVQSVRDSQGSAPKSGGASLRRYNEAALAQEIQELLSGWSQQLDSCHLIFLRTSTYSRHVFFSGKTPVFSRQDLRIRTVPFTTGRPTFNEAKRVHQMLMSVECFGDESLVQDFVPTSPPRHLHPDTGQLVVRPDLTTSKVKNKKVKNEGAEKKERKAVDNQTTDDGNDVDDANNDENQSDVEIELISTVTEINTADLEEFSWSVGPAKRNKKKKKKKGAEKEQERETTPTQGDNQDMTLPELSEEDALLKDKLYTCCKSGDVTLLSQLLQQLEFSAPADDNVSPTSQPVVSPGRHQNSETIGSQCLPRDNVMSDISSSLGDSKQTSNDAVNHTDTSNAIVESDSALHRNNSVSLESNIQTNISTNSNTISNFATPSPQSSIPTSDVGSDSQSKVGIFHKDFNNDGDCDSHSNTSKIDISNTFENNSKGKSDAVRERFDLVMGRCGEKQWSLLHVAASSGHADVVVRLLEAGCDPVLRDKTGKTAYNVAVNKDARNAFRRFRGNYPDRYDYESAQVPSALTADMEAEKRQREAEKKKLQKKAKQERLKERKAEEAKATQEKREKDRFLALSDREKRALAAEKRLLNQASEQGVTVVLNRCFECGVDMSGKVPFEYMDFRFCSPKCLKQHRMKPAK